jgi:hypothetical protein
MEKAMARIATPATKTDAPLAAQPLLEAVENQLGSRSGRKQDHRRTLGDPGL